MQMRNLRVAYRTKVRISDELTCANIKTNIAVYLKCSHKKEE